MSETITTTTGMLKLKGLVPMEDGAFDKAWQHKVVGGKQLVHLGTMLTTVAFRSMIGGTPLRPGASVELTLDGKVETKPIRSWDDLGDFGGDLISRGQLIGLPDDPDHEPPNDDPESCWHFDGESREAVGKRRAGLIAESRRRGN